MSISKYMTLSLLAGLFIGSEIQAPGRQNPPASKLHQQAQYDFEDKEEQLNHLTHPRWPDTNMRSNLDLMVTYPDYGNDMILFIVSMIPGSTKLQTQQLNLDHKQKNKHIGLALFNANTGYRIYMVPKSDVDKTIESLKACLSAYKQGICYNSDILPGTINPISGRNMLLIATFNPDLGRHLNGLSTDNIEDIIINIHLPNQFFPKSVQKSDWLPTANDPDFIFGL